MTENDYIAEYVREKFPELLGTDFTVWKMGRALECGIMKASLTCKQVAEAVTNLFKKYNAIQLSTADIEKYDFPTDDDMKYLRQQSVIRDEDPEAAGDDKLQRGFIKGCFICGNNGSHHGVCDICHDMSCWIPKEGDNDEKEN